MSSNNDIYTTGKPTEFGTFGYYGLLDWWNSEFISEERSYISQKYIPMGGGGLTSGQIQGSSASAVNFLTGLQSWFTNSSDEAISQKILLKAEQLANSTTPLLDIHFLYSAFIVHYYKKRNIDSKFYELAKTYCKTQINIAKEARLIFLKQFGLLPRHKGYEQLAIIFEKEQQYIEALKLCNLAKIEGWNSNWEKRILNLEKKLSRNSNCS